MRSSTLKKGFELFQIYSFADTTWADDKNSRKSSCCYLVFVHSAAFSWRSFMSPIFAMSTSEAESHWSLCLCERHSILSEVWAICTYTVTRPAKLFEDNVSHLQSMGILQAGPSTFTCAGCLSPILFEMGFLNCTKFLPPSK
jgi:hypothetical protein